MTLRFTQEELKNRIRSLQAHLVENKIDVAILSQSSDVFYYSGSVQPLYVVIPADNDAFALARKGLTRMRWEIEHIEIEAFSGGKDLSRIFAKRGISGSRRIGLTLDTLSYLSTMRMMKVFPDGVPEDIAWDVRMLRAVKSESEIAIQKEAARIMAKTPDVVRQALVEGITELELSAVLESHYRLNGNGVVVTSRREGVDALGFGACSSGINSLAGTKFEGICAGAGLSPGTPYGASRDVIKQCTPIIIDFAFNLYGYIVDQTRMASIGTPDSEVLRAYDIMQEIESAIFDAMKPGAVWENIYNLAVEMASEAGFADTFMGSGTERVRFVGHGVGLELDEPPYLAFGMKYELQEGMVIAVEPKVALPGIGIVGIEDTVVVRESGVEPMTFASKDFIVA